MSMAMMEVQKHLLCVDTSKQVFQLNGYDLGNDVLVLKEVRDDSGERLLIVSYEQMVSQIQRAGGQDMRYRNHNAIPRHIDYFRSPPPPENPDWWGHTHLVSVRENRLQFYPPRVDPQLTIWYNPVLHTFDASTPQWVAWFPLEANFEAFFETGQIGPQLAVHEDLLRDYIIYEFFLECGKLDVAREYGNRFMAKVRERIRQAQDFEMRTGTTYNFAPYSS
jgi:hypothetical protein